MVESTVRFRMSGDVVSRDVPDGAMLVDVQTGSAFKLNQVGAEVWQQLDGERAVADIIAGLEQRYRIGIEQLTRDVGALLEDLQKQGLVTRVGEG